MASHIKKPTIFDMTCHGVNVGASVRYGRAFSLGAAATRAHATESKR